MWFYSHFQKDVSYAQCLSFFARKAWTSQAPYPREATTIGGDICLHSPFSSNIFLLHSVEQILFRASSNQEPVESSSI